ncbi:MAG: recombinase family protein [Clostridia bacterium]|nr:recombinase family protein [Clostridia bacterium]
MEIKKVGCLYRVSTMKQVEENDIPMQRIACGNFIETQDGWKLEKEYIELGVSGYKLSEKKRDVLQDIKKDVLNRKIDILLVFMFDRIGRREEETPFVVEWLINEGIEVWSVKEGQRKIENRADKLINYITYWQAGGESEKTSIRVREAQVQMAEQGILTYGGKRNAPYGYEFIKSGTYTKKGVERQKLIVNEDEAKNIKDIFNLYGKMGYGIGRIAKYLNDKKIVPRRSKIWSSSSIGAILANPLYIGYPAYRKRTTVNVSISKKQPFDTWILPEKKIEDLAIVDEKIWYEVKNIRDTRNKKNNNENIIKDIKPKQTKSKLLFIGMIRCGECGYAFMTSGTKKKNKDGNVIQHSYYRCSSTKFMDTCSLNKKSLKKDMVEEVVLKCIYDFLNSLENIELSKAIKKGIINNCEEEEKQIKQYEKELNEIETNLSVLKNEVVKTINGESNFTSELLNELILEKESRKAELQKMKAGLESKVKEKSLEKQELSKIKDKIPVWKEEFENAELDVKKMLLSEIIREVRIYNNKYEIDFRLKLNEYVKESSKEQCKIIEDTVSLNRKE